MLLQTDSTTPFWSLALPRWAATQNVGLRVAPEQGPTWTCARCGAVVNGIDAATRHTELRGPQDRPQPRSAHCVPGRAREARRRSMILAKYKPSRG